MLDARRLRALQAVARTGSIAGAADELGYTASAVSQQLSALERETGADLLIREARGIRLTAAGRLLAARAAEILGQLADAEASLRALRDGRGGELRIAAFSSIATSLLPDVMARSAVEQPDLQLSLTIADNGPAIAALRDGRADLALVFDYTIVRIAPTAGLDSFPLFEEPMLVALPAGHPLAGEAPEPVEVRALAASPWICCATPACAAFTARIAQLAGIEPVIAMQTDDYPATLKLVAAGVGIALVPELALAARPDGLVIRPLAAPVPMRQVSAVLPPVPDRVPAAEAFGERLRGLQPGSPTVDGGTRMM